MYHPNIFISDFWLELMWIQTLFWEQWLWTGNYFGLDNSLAPCAHINTLIFSSGNLAIASLHTSMFLEGKNRLAGPEEPHVDMGKT